MHTCSPTVSMLMYEEPSWKDISLLVQILRSHTSKAILFQLAEFKFFFRSLPLFLFLLVLLLKNQELKGFWLCSTYFLTSQAFLLQKSEHFLFSVLHFRKTCPYIFLELVTTLLLLYLCRWRILLYRMTSATTEELWAVWGLTMSQ